MQRPVVWRECNLLESSVPMQPGLCWNSPTLSWYLFRGYLIIFIYFMIIL